MVRAVIFDCFGVLTTDGWLPFKHRYFSDNQEKYDEATRLNALANSGSIPYAQFLSMVSQMAGVTDHELDVVMHTTVENSPLFEFIRSLKSSYKIGMLSNISGDWLQELFDQEKIDLFDAIALSYQTGYAKPDKGAYQSITDMLGVAPSECLFIDDQERFVEAARDFGMSALLFKDIKTLKEDVSRILVRDMNP